MPIQPPKSTNHAPIMLFDLTAIDDDAANHSLECMCKSLAEPGAADEAIWALHESPYLERTLTAHYK